MTFRKDLFFLITILLASFVIRWFQISQIPYPLEHDETNWIINSQLFRYNFVGAERGIWSHNDTLAQIFPISLKINQVSFLLFGTDYYSPKKMLVLLNIASLFFFYCFLKNTISKKASLVTLLLYSLSTYKLITSRIAFPHCYTEFFIYPAFLMIILISKNHKFRSALYLIVSGILISAALLTYNLGYLLPLIGIIFTLTRLIKEKIKPLFSFLLIMSFLIPIILSSKIWLPGIMEEFTARQLVLQNTIINTGTNKLQFNNAKKNLLTIYEQLFVTLKYETTDMLISYPGTLINKWVSLLFVMGLLLAVFNLRKYYFIFLFFIINILSYQIIMGLYLPRMWFVTISSLFIFAGIPIEKLITISQKQPILKMVTIVIITVLFSIIIRDEILRFFNHAVISIRYKEVIRESMDLIKENKEEIGSGLTIISKKEEDAVRINPYLSFYYLAVNPNNTLVLKTSSRQNLGSYTEMEYMKAKSDIINSSQVIIIESQINSIILNQPIEILNNCYFKTNKYHYYSKLTKLNCQG